MKLTRPGTLRFVLVASALVLGGVAQYLIGDGNFRWAVTPYLVAVVAMALASANRPLSSFDAGGTGEAPASDPNLTSAHLDAHDPRPVGFAPGERRIERLAGFALIALSLLLLFVALRRFVTGPPNTLAWYCYGASVILLVLSLPTLEGRWTALIGRLRQRSHVSFHVPSLLPWAVLGAILALALLVRIYHLDQLPAGLWYDEAQNLASARQIEGDPGSTPVFVPSTNFTSLFLMPIAVVIELTGVTINAGRLVSVAFGLAGIVAVFLLVRLMLGNGLALVAAFLIAVMRWDISWSRIGLNGITAPFFAALTAYLTLRAVRSGRASDFGFAGAALGLGAWFYSSLLVYPLVVGFILLHHFISQRQEVRRFAARVLVMAVVALVVASPVAQTAIVDSEQFFDRPKTTSVFSLMSFGDAIVQIRETLREHALMFNYRGDENPRHNLPHEPMLDFGSGMLFLLGLGLALGRWRDTALLSMPFWLLFMVLPGVLTVPWESPQSLRTITVIPAIAVIIALVVGVIWRAGRSAPWPSVRRATPLVIAALLSWIAFQNINTYFGEQAQNPAVYASFSTDETLMARHMIEQQRQGYTLLTSRQFMFSLNTSLLANNPQYETIRAPAEVPIDPSRVWRGASIYLEPREASVYRLLKTYYPEGQFQEVRPPGGGEPLYYSAVVSREQLMDRQGLVARYTLSDGSVRETTERITERAWIVDFSPDDVPFDFSWKGALHASKPGEYALALEGNGEVVVILDETAILHPGQRRVEIELAVGLHSLVVQGRVEDRAGLLRLWWRPPGGRPAPIPAGNLFHDLVRPIGLAGRFYAGRDEVELSDATRVTPAMDAFYYDPVIPEPYLAVWEGTLDVPEMGVYGFRVDGAGTVKLYLHDRLWAQHPPTDSIESTVSLRLGADTSKIRVEYLSESPPSQFKVLWSPPGRDFEQIPIELLSPDPDHMFRIVSTGE